MWSVTTFPYVTVIRGTTHDTWDELASEFNDYTRNKYLNACIKYDPISGMKLTPYQALPSLGAIAKTCYDLNPSDSNRPITCLWCHTSCSKTCSQLEYMVEWVVIRIQMSPYPCGTWYGRKIRTHIPSPWAHRSISRNSSLLSPSSPWSSWGKRSSRRDMWGVTRAIL